MIISATLFTQEESLISTIHLGLLSLSLSSHAIIILSTTNKMISTGRNSFCQEKEPQEAHPTE